MKYTVLAVLLNGGERRFLTRVWLSGIVYDGFGLCVCWFFLLPLSFDDVYIKSIDYQTN